MLRPSLKSLCLVLLLIAGMATQSVTNGIARAGGAGAMAGTVQLAGAEGGDRLLADLLQSICSQEQGGHGKSALQDCLCQFCLPAAIDLTAGFPAQDGEPRKLAGQAVPWPDSLILPPSRRLAGDGPSRAPPAIA
ncbi:conserved exported protein of unknown function [Magnetospirillum sp. XM-1]|nr:conserved exported protein of unknown function [Magnetospirillum sp. XM-1]